MTGIEFPRRKSRPHRGRKRGCPTRQSGLRKNPFTVDGDAFENDVALIVQNSLKSHPVSDEVGTVYHAAQKLQQMFDGSPLRCHRKAGTGNEGAVRDRAGRSCGPRKSRARRATVEEGTLHGQSISGVRFASECSCYSRHVGSLTGMR